MSGSRPRRASCISLPEGLLADRSLEGVLDDEGRPLVEQLPSDEQVCPYPGSRQGRPMNRAALEQVRRYWPSLTATVASLAGPDLHAAWSASLTCCAAALLAPEPVPAAWAALYKACVGFSQVFTFLCLESDEAAASPLPSGIMPWLEEGDWLLGSRQVCAGSRGQIEELYACFRGQACPGTPLEIPRRSPAEAVALQAAMALAAYHDRRGLGKRLLEQGQAPWLYAVTYVPGLPPERARRFFRPGESPRALEDYLLTL